MAEKIMPPIAALLDFVREMLGKDKR